MSAYATDVACRLRLRLATALRKILAVVDPYEPTTATPTIYVHTSSYPTYAVGGASVRFTLSDGSL